MSLSVNNPINTSFIDNSHFIDNPQIPFARDEEEESPPIELSTQEETAVKHIPSYQLIRQGYRRAEIQQDKETFRLLAAGAGLVIPSLIKVFCKVPFDLRFLIFPVFSGLILGVREICWYREKNVLQGPTVEPRKEKDLDVGEIQRVIKSLKDLTKNGNDLDPYKRTKFNTDLETLEKIQDVYENKRSKEDE